MREIINNWHSRFRTFFKMQDYHNLIIRQHKTLIVIPSQMIVTILIICWSKIQSESFKNITAIRFNCKYYCLSNLKTNYCQLYLIIMVLGQKAHSGHQASIWNKPQLCDNCSSCLKTNKQKNTPFNCFSHKQNYVTAFLLQNPDQLFYQFQN